MSEHDVAPRGAQRGQQRRNHRCGQQHGCRSNHHDHCPASARPRSRVALRVRRSCWRGDRMTDSKWRASARGRRLYRRILPRFAESRRASGSSNGSARRFPRLGGEPRPHARLLSRLSRGQDLRPVSGSIPRPSRMDTRSALLLRQNPRLHRQHLLPPRANRRFLTNLPRKL